MDIFGELISRRLHNEIKTQSKRYQVFRCFELYTIKRNHRRFCRVLRGNKRKADKSKLTSRTNDFDGLCLEKSFLCFWFSKITVSKIRDKRNKTKKDRVSRKNPLEKIEK